LCLHQFIDTPGGCYGDNSFTESDNSALKRDVCGPKANNKLDIALDATITHTDKRFKKLDMDAHKLTGQTSLCSGVVSEEYHELSKMLNPHAASEWRGNGRPLRHWIVLKASQNILRSLRKKISSPNCAFFMIAQPGQQCLDVEKSAIANQDPLHTPPRVFFCKKKTVVREVRKNDETDNEEEDKSPLPEYS
jgi:hypothetical protein